MPDNGLPRREILSHIQDIQRVFAKGIAVRAGSFKLYVLRGPSRKFAVILRKTLKGAIRRNRMKRWTREAYRLNKHAFPNNTWIIFFFSTDSSTLSFETILKDIKKILPMLQQKFNI